MMTDSSMGPEYFIPEANPDQSYHELIVPLRHNKIKIGCNKWSCCCIFHKAQCQKFHYERWESKEMPDITKMPVNSSAHGSLARMFFVALSIFLFFGMMPCTKTLFETMLYSMGELFASLSRKLPYPFA